MAKPQVSPEEKSGKLLQKKELSWESRCGDKAQRSKLAVPHPGCAVTVSAAGLYWEAQAEPPCWGGRRVQQLGLSLCWWGLKRWQRGV